MFNAPRPTQAYGVSSSTNFGGSFVDENPLAVSVYDGLDPWSAAPSPSPPAVTSIFTSAIVLCVADATVPSIYHQSFSIVDPTNSGETSVNSLSRVLGTSGLPAGIIDKIVNLVSTRPRVSKLEFFVALALVALAQSGKDVSVEQVAALAQQNDLPEPSLDLSALTAAPSAFVYNKSNIDVTARAPAPAYSSDDPWNSRFAPSGTGAIDAAQGSVANGMPSSVSGTGMPKDWWRKQENVTVKFLGQQGFILNRYIVYEVLTDRGPPVSRRYSEFTVLWDCLIHRYPFRLIPQLPPKRIGPDENFLEQRRKGLQRFLTFVINHPVIKDDGLLAVFLAEPSFEQWRKYSSISLEEESTSKRVDRVEEMSIPSDLEDKLGNVRGKISPLIEAWQKIGILVERIIRKREAEAVRTPPALRRTYLPTHFAFPLFSSPFLDSTDSRDPSLSAVSLTSGGSIFATFPSGVGAGGAPSAGPASGMQADLSRLTNTLKALVEVNGQCWRGEDCELSEGVKQGVRKISEHTQRQADILEQRTQRLLYTTLEGLKSQRDLYIGMRDLFIRHDRLSVDQVERLKKRVEKTSLKLEGVHAVKKEGWQDEADKLAGIVEKDKATIAAQLNRRMFIRACMWHELRVVLHNRENTLLTHLVQTFAGEEQEYAEGVAADWASLVEAVESMPLE
ncbi:hypothetical protein HETIRDRAFT_50485 [Heterobasidion irregulare TC 32-1]|uniref:Sorting nexin MVP1 n=1 Tax=Heterobasidion irregulare (strain TC 32-1) TaxID=747525 RepID=W4K075_HETIT|nr:uncharacterized protein HETIRDRAFT_50485 [Heterobasidion irregulare TC 32-1]ETW78740.1 hypothetical protein HETIRDRAFT_50485 [Heterobasidion irregulare TC 32-1]